jgi:3-hydroxybutyryl-CoA dehydratase
LKKGDTFTFKFTTNRSVYEGFKAIFLDNNPLHTDADFAVKKGFKAAVMHGNILCGYLSYFIGEGLPDKNVIIHSQEIKYLLPVYLNDELTLHAKIEHVSEAVRVLEFTFNFENQQRQKIAKGKITIGLI